MRRLARVGLTFGRCSTLQRCFHEESAAVLKGDVPFDKEAAKVNQQAMDATVAQVGAAELRVPPLARTDMHANSLTAQGVGEPDQARWQSIRT